MSTHEEQIHSITRTKDFLFDLLDPKKTPKVPKVIRKRASQCLKHYPIVVDLFISNCIMYAQNEEVQVAEQADATDSKSVT